MQMNLKEKELLQDCWEIVEAYKKVPANKRNDFKKAMINFAELLADEK